MYNIERSLYNQTLLADLHVTPLERKAHIDTIATEAVKQHYITPSMFLTQYDYAGLHPAEAACNARKARTDWNTETIRQDSDRWMVCAYTGYTRNQMLAAMLNDSLYAEYDAYYAEANRRDYAN